MEDPILTIRGCRQESNSWLCQWIIYEDWFELTEIKTLAWITSQRAQYNLGASFMWSVTGNYFWNKLFKLLLSASNWAGGGQLDPSSTLGSVQHLHYTTRTIIIWHLVSWSTITLLNLAPDTFIEAEIVMIWTCWTMIQEQDSCGYSFPTAALYNSSIKVTQGHEIGLKHLQKRSLSSV